MSATSTDRLVVDLLDPTLYQRNPHDVWDRLRAEEPVYHDRRNGLWGITRHADLLDVERRSSVFPSANSYRVIPAYDEANMIAQDDPRHRQQRMLVQHEFTRAAVAAKRAPDIAALTTQLIDAVVADGEAEIVDALAAQLPARQTARLLGFAEDQWRDVKSWSERLMRIDMRDRDGEIFTEFVDANTEFATCLGAVARNKFATGCPADADLISIWLNAEIDGERLPPQAIVHEVGLFISGGAETTRTAISHGLRAFADHPDQWEAMAADPALVPGAVEEVLRWVTPLNNMFRRAAQDDEIGGQQIRRGDRIALLYPAANRDPAVFERPHEFDIHRSPNPHVSFGFGTHLCLGTNVARTTLAEVFGQLSRRVTDLRVASEPDVEPNIFARAVRSFRLGWTQR